MTNDLKVPDNLQITLYPEDVMEFVAHLTDGPEPLEVEARTWMLKHYDRLSEVMEYAAREYIRENWGRNA